MYLCLNKEGVLEEKTIRLNNIASFLDDKIRIILKVNWLYF